MFAKKIVVLVATALVGLAMAVGCGNAEADGELTGQSEDALGRRTLGDVEPSEPATLETAPVAERQQPSPVTCEGHQDHGGRICCDATHCCINILGVINCNLPPRPTKKL
jgi:hypothetical protein